MISRAGHRRQRGLRVACFATLLFALMVNPQPVTAPPGGNWRERALMFAESQNMFGRLHMTGQWYTGSFLRFQFDENTAIMSDFTVVARSMTTAVFQTIVPDIAAIGGSGINGTVFEYTSTAFRLAAFNNPASALIYRSNATALNLTFTLSSGVDASRDGQSLNLSTPEMTGVLIVTGSATLSLVGFQAFAHLPPGTSAVFRTNSVHGESAVGAEGQTALANATRLQLLALESFGVGFEGDVEASDVQYGGVSREDSNLTPAGFLASLDREPTSSRLVALHAHRSMIDYGNQSTFQVRLDDADMLKLPGLDDIVEYVGTSAVYSTIVGANGILILMYLPDPGRHVFSMQTISSSADEPGLNPIHLFAIVAIVLVLVGAAAAFMLRRKPLA